MTEEIIIDGVNVSDCDLYCSRGYCMDDNISPVDCKDRPNCEYKQLKRLEQENKELKEKKDKYYQQTLDDEILMNELSLEVDLRKKESDFYLEKLSKYCSALKEIKEIVNGHASPPECDYYGSYKNACEPCALRILKQTEGKIIDVINEVLQ